MNNSIDEQKDLNARKLQLKCYLHEQLSMLCNLIDKSDSIFDEGIVYEYVNESKGLSVTFDISVNNNVQQ